MSLLEQSATIIVQIGPFLDSTDGVTEESGLSPGVEISKAGAAFASKNEANTPTHDAEGWYTCALGTSDTDTVGRLVLKAQDNANHLPVWHEFFVVPSGVYETIASNVESTYDIQEVLRIVLAALAGKSTGGGTANPAFRDVGDTKDRISATVDSDGNRTSMTLDGS